MLLAAVLIGYVALAATFYFFAAKSAATVVDSHSVARTTDVELTVVEGGMVTVGDVRKAA